MIINIFYCNYTTMETLVDFMSAVDLALRNCLFLWGGERSKLNCWEVGSLRRKFAGDNATKPEFISNLGMDDKSNSVGLPDIRYLVA